MKRTKKATVELGTKFHYDYCDSRPKWEVIQSRGKGTWIAEIVESPDWNGATKCFSSEEIQSALAHEAFWDQCLNDSAKFYQGLHEGQIVHHHHHGNAFTRCRVARSKKLLPFALVGEWKEWELPKRQADGSIYYGYHAQQILEERLFQPHASQIWEFNAHGQPNPKDLPAIKILDHVPPMTPEQKEQARAIEHLDSIRKLLNTNVETLEQAEATFKRIEDIIASYRI